MRDRPRDMEILCRISGSELLESFFMVPALLPSLQWWSKLERAPFSNALIGRKNVSFEGHLALMPPGR
ncbi:hypothetical protein CIRG_07324 [Coccidioides immitis RMSCC 2394]|uniref:Uncharacterized protein n=1 Tax=Coccidioides immitis RMSCC 2394 TaxID=404692 RepID=A0A0J6YL43_COCIT|nr:hypothetical protein CIRG_07324 [Coccidioides immitis RMSCC 2394]